MATRKANVGLTPKQEQALIALLNEPTIERAAKTAGVGERTLHRWLDDETFSRAYRRARREAFAQAMGASQKFAPVAVQVLAKIMTDTSAPMSSRVSAATALLKFSRESIELDDLATRVDDLEKAMKDEAQRVADQAATGSWRSSGCASPAA